MGGATRLLADKYQVPERPMLEHYAQLRNEWKAELLKILLIIRSCKNPARFSP
jgi:hypothetical protein